MPTWITDLVIVAPWLAALCLAAWVGVKVWPVMRKLSHFVDDVVGEPARPGVPPRPGLMERLATVEDHTANIDARTAALDNRTAAIEHQLMPNHGSSMHDALSRVETHLGTNTDRTETP